MEPQKALEIVKQALGAVQIRYDQTPILTQAITVLEQAVQPKQEKK